MKKAGATKSFWALDLAKKGDPEAFRWQELPAWRGRPRVLPVAVAQSDGATDCFYLFSGRQTVPGMLPLLLTDAHRYNPKTRRWKKLRDVAPKGQPTRCVMGATAAASDSCGPTSRGSARTWPRVRWTP